MITMAAVSVAETVAVLATTVTMVASAWALATMAAAEWAAEVAVDLAMAVATTAVMVDLVAVLAVDSAAVTVPFISYICEVFPTVYLKMTSLNGSVLLLTLWISQLSTTTKVDPRVKQMLCSKLNLMRKKPCPKIGKICNIAT